MTVSDAHIELDITVDKRSTSVAPELPDEVKDYFLNEAQSRFVKKRYGKNNMYRAGFEEIQKRTEDLRSIVVEDTGLLQLDFDDDERSFIELDVNSNDYLLQGTYWFFIKGRVRLVKEGCSDKWSRIELVQQDDLERVKDDPFNKPGYDLPIAYFQNGRLYVERDEDKSFELREFQLTYIKEPAQVNIGTYGFPVVEFDMPEHTHKEIVQLAASIVLESIESNRINTIIEQLKTIE